MSKALDLLRRIVEDYDDTGCQDCGVVSGALHAEAKAFLARTKEKAGKPRPTGLTPAKDVDAGDLVRAALLEFVRDIEQTGGVVRDAKGLHAPVADADWVDLGETYNRACGALDRKPMVEEADEEDTDDDPAAGRK